MTIELYGHYYYRNENHVPRRITIVGEGSTKGFYKYVEGHFTKEEIAAKDPEVFVIHANKIIE